MRLKSHLEGLTNISFVMDHVPAVIVGEAYQDLPTDQKKFIDMYTQSPSLGKVARRMHITVDKARELGDRTFRFLAKYAIKSGYHPQEQQEGNASSVNNSAGEQKSRSSLEKRVKEPSTDLVASMMATDDSLTERLYNELNGYIRNFIYYIVEDDDVADDLTSETWLRVVKRESNGNLQIDAMKGTAKIYLCAIARNIVIDYLRHKGTVGDVLPIDAGNTDEKFHSKAPASYDPSWETKNFELGDVITRVIDSLPKKYRSIINIIAVNGDTFEQAAKILSITEATAIWRYHKARELFSEKIHRYNRSGWMPSPKSFAAKRDNLQSYYKEVLGEISYTDFVRSHIPSDMLAKIVGELTPKSQSRYSDFFVDNMTNAMYANKHGITGRVTGGQKFFVAKMITMKAIGLGCTPNSGGATTIHVKSTRSTFPKTTEDINEIPAAELSEAFTHEHKIAENMLKEKDLTAIVDSLVK